jgi:hypothetical protein
MKMKSQEENCPFSSLITARKGGYPSELPDTLFQEGASPSVIEKIARSKSAPYNQLSPERQKRANGCFPSTVTIPGMPQMGTFQPASTTCWEQPLGEGSVILD